MKVSELKLGSGKAEIKVLLKNEETGVISFEYNLKDLKANKQIALLNIKCSLVKKTELFLKCVNNNLSVVTVSCCHCGSQTRLDFCYQGLQQIDGLARYCEIVIR
jgi:1-deoxy-D-xylulose 5-phosphate reductoisomerase